MNRKKIIKRTQIKIAIGIVIGIILSVWSGMQLRYNCVKPAIPIWQALLKRDNVHYFIIESEYYFGIDWCYVKDGEKQPVILLGRTPESELAWCLSSAQYGNKFLIKGTIQTEYQELTEKEVILVEDWEIIAPIHRTYGMSEEDTDTRLIKPRLYLDRYDVLIGNYYKIVTDIRAIVPLEQSLIWKNSEFSCYYISSDIVNGKVQWYIVGDEWKNNGIHHYHDEEKIPINLEGVPLEAHFNELILRHFRNDFLIEGEFDRENAVLEVKEWYILWPISRAYGFPESSYYFTEEDVIKGLYVP